MNLKASLSFFVMATRKIFIVLAQMNICRPLIRAKYAEHISSLDENMHDMSLKEEMRNAKM